MEHVQRRSGTLRQEQRTAHRGLLDERPARLADVRPVGLALAQVLGGQPVGDVLVLAVHHAHAAVLAHLAHRTVSATVIRHPTVGHHRLDRRDAARDHVPDLLDDMEAEVTGEDGVQAAVDRHAALELLATLGHRVDEAKRRFLEGEVEHSGVPAVDRCVRVLRPFGRQDALEVHLVMHVWVDGAWNYQASACVDDTAGLARRAALVEPGDAVAPDGDVERALAVGADDGAARDEHVVDAALLVHATVLSNRAGRNRSSAAIWRSSINSSATRSPSTGANVTPLWVATT